MTFALRLPFLAVVASIGFAAGPAWAQDAMATDAMGSAMAGDAMAGDAMMSDDDLKLCLEQAAMITFPQVMDAAAAACHDMHNGMMGDAMGGDAMGGDAMATDAMAPDAMAPATK